MNKSWSINIAKAYVLLSFIFFFGFNLMGTPISGTVSGDMGMAVKYVIFALYLLGFRWFRILTIILAITTFGLSLLYSFSDGYYLLDVIGAGSLLYYAIHYDRK